MYSVKPIHNPLGWPYNHFFMLDISSYSEDALEMEIAICDRALVVEQYGWILPNSTSGWVGAGGALFMAAPTGGLSLAFAATFKVSRTVLQQVELKQHQKRLQEATTEKEKRIKARRWCVPSQIIQLSGAGTGSLFFGALGPSRLGKSTCLTKLFGLERNVFGAGRDHKNRTLTVKWHRVQILGRQAVTLVDFPGSNETDHAVASLSSCSTDLLHCYVFILDYANVHTNSHQKLLRLFTSNFLDKDVPPCLVLLNRFDAVISPDWLDKPALALEDIKQRTRQVISLLDEAHGGPTVRMRLKASSNLTHLKKADIVKITYLDDLSVSPMVIGLLRDFVKQGMFWDVQALRAWPTAVCI